MRKISIAFILVLVQQVCFAQTADEVKAIFPGKEAVFLNDNQTVKLYMKDDVPVAETNNIIDLMILSEKNASSYSHYSIYHSDYSQLTNMDAYTMVPNGTKYQKAKIANQKTSGGDFDENIFYDDEQETSFDFTSLTQNAIGHVEYSQFHKDVHVLSPFYFPTSIPLVNGSLTVEVPDDISINYVVKNDPKGLFQFTTEKKHKTTIYKWTLKNVKPIDEWSDEPSSAYFEPHIIIYVTSYNGKDGPQHFLGSLDDLYAWDQGFLKELNTTEDATLKKTVDSVITGKTTELSKAEAVYHWVQQNIKYVAFENGVEGFRPRQAADICRKRYGDCKDMSSIITKMLRIAGVKAYYTWIGSRELPYDYTDIPSPIVDNHMISTANIDGKWIFIDGTDPNATFALPPAGIQDKQALIAISDKEYKVLRVPITPVETNLIVDSTFISFTNDGIKGHSNVNYYGYFGEDIYNTLLYSDDKETKDFVKSKMGKASNKFILDDDYKIIKTDSETKAACITANFEIPGYGEKVGDEYYINLNLEKLFEDQVIDTVKRKVPKQEEFEYAIRESHILDIPKGYKVTYVPQNYSFENDIVSINIFYTIKGGKITATQEIKSKKLYIAPADFDEWNKAMKGVQPQYKETVVLGKI